MFFLQLLREVTALKLLKIKSCFDLQKYFLNGKFVDYFNRIPAFILGFRGQ